jgi:hypothetical protein
MKVKMKLFTLIVIFVAATSAATSLVAQTEPPAQAAPASQTPPAAQPARRPLSPQGTASAQVLGQ